MRRWKDDHMSRDYLENEENSPMDVCQSPQHSANVRQFKNIFEQTIQEQESEPPKRQEVPRRQLIDLSPLHQAQDNIPKIPEHLRGINTPLNQHFNQQQQQQQHQQKQQQQQQQKQVLNFRLANSIRFLVNRFS